jgi:hypothetical protein
MHFGSQCKLTTLTHDHESCFAMRQQRHYLIAEIDMKSKEDEVSRYFN